MGIPTLISTSTASDSSSIDITSGIDSTYDEYMFVFTDIGPATDNVNFQFNGSDDASSWSYDVIKTTTLFMAGHAEDDDAEETGLEYRASEDVAQGTGAAYLLRGLGNDADQSCAGILHLFNPSNTTYVTHFYSRTQSMTSNDNADDVFGAGYFNITGAITAIRFAMSSGNFDGVIQMYGIA